MPRTLTPSTSATRALSSAHGEQCDYRASKRQTKLRPKPRGISSQGSGADWHFRNQSDHLWVGELGREYDRNTPIGSRLLDVLVKNVTQRGFDYHPNTGDAKFDAEAKQYIDELLADPKRIDVQGQYTFAQLTRMVLRDTYAAGDAFGVFTADGPLATREAHECRQPRIRGVKHRNNVLGVELDEDRRRVGYHFTHSPISPLSPSVKHEDLYFVEAESIDGDWKTPNVLHLRDPKRVTQTRGVSIFAPIFDYLGMFEDQQFQQLVKQQLANMFLLKRQRDVDFNPKMLGKRLRSGVESDQETEVARLLEELYPGAELQGLPGEQIDLLSANIPANEWFDHMRLVLRIMGVALGVPYVLIMLDTADTNFHGYRGALVEAREAFRDAQGWLAGMWHTPVVEHYLHRWADEDASVARYRERTYREARRRRPKADRFNFLRHSWTLPGWPAVDALKDAQANAVGLATGVMDRDTIARQLDRTGEEQARRVVTGNRDYWMLGVQQAIADLASIGQKDAPLEVIERWASRYAPGPIGDRTQITMSADPAQEAADA
ncbi:Phage portal protein, lambda family [Posidoniimonas corsicana]|uniref:Phage portal protein, lambda family n=1 Tax=Posidoniimonas corsicana TaxID=1938618 RepID=A0A5C5VCI3_9BACT|nr:phage portal protein [Posidoniimonas corsicana]TWT35325.1 Phage portal protein, lambda family [Posidoniimonas corsicana]